MSAGAFSPHYANVLAAADDLALLSGDPIHMQVQLDKVQKFADWSGMELAPHKCEASAILLRTYMAQKSVFATDWGVIEPFLLQLRI